jgi:hypothetical protein
MGGVLAVVLVLVAYEAAIFAASSEKSAREQAKQAFIAECGRRGFVGEEFRGPQRIKSAKTTYGYVWTNESSGVQIATMVRYFPSGVEAWLTQSAQFTPYCDGTRAACQ